MASAAGAVLKDPRNIRDKSYQLSCIKTLIKFLSESGYDAPISPKILTSPSTKDFQHIFKFLYWHLDPTYEAGSKKFEEELPVLLKGLKYRFYLLLKHFFYVDILLLMTLQRVIYSPLAQFMPGLHFLQC